MENDKHLPVFRLLAVKRKAGWNPQIEMLLQRQIFNIQ